MNKQELLKVAKPILFNTDMVRAILDNRKTVTRRVVKNVYNLNSYPHIKGNFMDDTVMPEQPMSFKSLTVGDAKYQKGYILYVRETFGAYDNADYCLYKADYKDGQKYYMYGEHRCDLPKWKPSIHMPKKHARIFLRVTDVRVERLQDITEDEAVKEGFIATFRDGLYMTAKDMFLKEMMDIYGVSDGYVFVYDFKKIKVKKGE